MDLFKRLKRLLESQSLITERWGISKMRPTLRRDGLMFWVNCTRFEGLIKIRCCDNDGTYRIIYSPSDKDEVIEQKNVKERDIVNVIAKEIGQSRVFLDYLFDLYLM